MKKLSIQNHMFLIMMGFFSSTIHANLKQQEKNMINVDFSLIDYGIKMLESCHSGKIDKIELGQYLDLPEMKAIFARYNHNNRPIESRVSKQDYESFMTYLCQGKIEKITHPRMKSLIADYSWGMNNVSLIKKDIENVKQNIHSWVEQAVLKIPRNSYIAEFKKDIQYKVFFLVDPGGSYPWANQYGKVSALYFDVLKLRGLDIKDRTQDLDEQVMAGFIAHELFHVVHKDKPQAHSKSKWLLWNVLAEGSASIFGNNMPNALGEKLRSQEQILCDKRMLEEWIKHSQNNMKNIENFWLMYDKWDKNPPSDEEFFTTLVEHNWMASPKNGLFIGNLYRIGVEMLLKIKSSLGQEAFEEVLSNSEKLPSVWQKAMKKN